MYYSTWGCISYRISLSKRSNSSERFKESNNGIVSLTLNHYCACRLMFSCQWCQYFRMWPFNSWRRLGLIYVAPATCLDYVFKSWMCAFIYVLLCFWPTVKHVCLPLAPRCGPDRQLIMRHCARHHKIRNTKSAFPRSSRLVLRLVGDVVQLIDTCS